MKQFLLIALVVLLVAVSGYFLRQYAMRQASTPVSAEETVSSLEGQPETTPSTGPERAVEVVQDITLTISTPQNNATVTSPSIAVRGKTAARAEVFVNDAETVADAGGNFSVTITLDEGDNYILVAANDASGNYSEKELTVIYAP